MAQRVKPPVNMVHQDAIHCETVKKELKSAVIYQDFTINPHSLKKNSTYELFKISCVQYYKNAISIQRKEISSTVKTESLKITLSFKHSFNAKNKLRVSHGPAVCNCNGFNKAIP